MPQHDLPDGKEDLGNLIDFRVHLRRRIDQSTQDNDAQGAEPSTQEVYRRAEYGDGKTPRFSRYDLLWLGMIVAIGAVFWLMTHR